MCAGCGALGGGADVAARAPAWARGDVRRPQPGSDRHRPAAAGVGRPAAAPVPGRAPGAGRGCLAWLRSDAPCSPDRLFCHVYGRAKTASQFILDAARLGPADDATAVTAAQLRDVVERLITAGQWQPGEPDIVIVTDTGYDVTRLAWVLRDLPVDRNRRSSFAPPRRTTARPSRRHGTESTRG